MTPLGRVHNPEQAARVARSLAQERLLHGHWGSSDRVACAKLMDPKVSLR